MCLAVPMELIRVDGEVGTAQLEQVRYDVNLSLVDGAEVGEYVIVHAGFAIEKLDREEAEARLALFAEWAEALDAEREQRG